MDQVPLATRAAPPTTAITTGPLLGCPAANLVPPVASPPLAPELLQAWPRSAQWATAFLLGVAVALLAVHSLGHLRYGTRPLELERGAVLSYRVDLNQARRAELLQLPGIGSNMAQRIEDYRQANGRFRSVEDLTRVHGIGPATLERLRPWVIVEEEEVTVPALDVMPQRLPTRRGAAPARGSTPAAGQSKKAASLTARIDINQASAEELRQLPGIGPKLSQRIVDEREKGQFKTVDELRRVPGIGAKTLERLRPFISVQTDQTARVTRFMEKGEHP